jgi:glyoxylase-like metal-dependent hydrolase (beta-lactamase superfamily II)
MLTAFGVSPVKSPPRPDRLLKDGDLIDLGDLHFEVLYTPGHSSGGICLLGHGVVFSGDTLFKLGIGRTDFPGMSHERLIKSALVKSSWYCLMKPLSIPGTDQPPPLAMNAEGILFSSDYTLGIL